MVVGNGLFPSKHNSCLSCRWFLEKLHGSWDGILYACSMLCKATHFLSWKGQKYSWAVTNSQKYLPHHPLQLKEGGLSQGLVEKWKEWEQEHKGHLKDRLSVVLCKDVQHFLSWSYISFTSCNMRVLLNQMVLLHIRRKELHSWQQDHREKRQDCARTSTSDIYPFLVIQVLIPLFQAWKLYASMHRWIFLISISLLQTLLRSNQLVLSVTSLTHKKMHT